jgi:hypothetical protein
LSTAITKDGQTTTTSRILFAQGISSTLTTDATSATTGSILTAGGISTQKALFVGTTATLGIGTTPASITLNGQSGTGAAKGWAILPQVAGVAAGIIGSESYVFGSSDTNLVIQAATSKSVKIFGGAGGSGLTISSTGALSAATADEVVGNFNSSHVYGSAIQFQNSGTTIGNIGGSAGYLGGAADDLAVSVYGSHNLDFGNNGSLRARIDTSGNLLVGGTSGGRIASWDTGGTTNLYLRSSALPSSSHMMEIINTNSNGGSPITFQYFQTVYGAAGTIVCTTTNTAYNTSSDYRMKENVQPMTGGLSTIAALKPVIFDWIPSKTAGEGFIAHELQAVIPAAVSGEKDALYEDGSINAQGVDFGKIVPHLVAAMQELTTRLAALEAK